MANELRKILRVDQLSNATLRLGLGSLTTTFVTSASELTIDKQLNMSDTKIVNLASPEATSDAATKGYVDTAVATAVADSAISVTDGATTVDSVDSIKVAGSGDLKATVATGAAGEAVVTVVHELGEGTGTNNSGAQFIQDVKKTADGHVTEVVTAEITPATIGAQAANATLTSVTEAGNGILTKTAEGTVAAREITGEGAITVSNGDGIAANPVIKVAAASTTTAGVVQLTNDLVSDSATMALTAAQGKALKGEVDSKLPLAGGTMTGTLTLAASPVGDNDAATKAYVDAVAEGLDIHAEVAVATTENITLSGLQTIDGYAVQAGDRVLVKDQTNGVENGIYVAGNDAWTRAEDCDEDIELTRCYVFVGNGATYAGFGFSQVATATIGTTAVVWTVFSRATKYSVVAAADSPVSVSAEGSKFTIDIAAASTSVAGAVKLNNTLTSESTEEALTAAQGKALKDALDKEIDDRTTAVQAVSDAKIAKMSGAVEGNLTMATATGEVADAGVKVAAGALADTTDLVSGAQVMDYVEAQIEAATPTSVIVPVALTLGTDPTYTSTVVIPAGAYLESVNLIVETPYEGADVTISASVGEVTLIDATWNDPATVGDYEGNSNVFIMGQSTINAVVSGTPTAGAAKLFVKYSKEVQV